MRKSFIFSVIFLEMICLSSCVSIHRRNYFVEGEFFGVNEYNKEEKFYFTVLEISKNEYENAQGINVVNDIYKKKYYSLKLYYVVNQSDEKNYITFLNLKDYGSPITYKDDNHNIIRPFMCDREYMDIDIEKDALYIIEIPTREAFVYFYKGGEKNDKFGFIRKYYISFSE